MAILRKMAYLAKMAETVINRQNCQIVDKNSNEIQRVPFEMFINDQVVNVILI